MGVLVSRRCFVFPLRRLPATDYQSAIPLLRRVMIGRAAFFQRRGRRHRSVDCHLRPLRKQVEAIAGEGFGHEEGHRLAQPRESRRTPFSTYRYMYKYDGR